MHPNVMIASVRPTAYEQHMAAAKNWNGVEPGNLPATIPDIAGFMTRGLFSCPADPGNDGGKFVFNHRAALVVSEMYIECGTGGTWQMHRVRPDPGGGPNIKDLIKSGSAGISHIKQELPILHIGEWLELTSVGITSGASRAKVFVRYTDEYVS